MNGINNPIIAPAPHFTKKGNTTRMTMAHVLIALAPVVIASVVIFGHLVILNVFFCVLFCMGFEILYNMLLKKKWNKQGLKDNSAWDLSSAVTGVILALNLPTALNIWGMNIAGEANANGIIPVYFSFDTVIACFLGSLVAIVLVKMLFGGIGKNFANPAMIGRIFLFIAFAGAFTGIYAGVGENGGILQGVTQATWLGEKFVTDAAGVTSLNINIPMLDMFFGRIGSAAVGEVCVIAILVGYIYLSVMRVIDFRIPLVVVASALVFVFLFDGLIVNTLSGMDYLRFVGMHALSGGLIFGAVFMATDYASSPKTFWGRLIFAAGIGLLTAIMRTWTSMPEGISFAIVIMNVVTPLIDKIIRPRPFGVAKEKKPKEAAANAGGTK
ncbi:MAG: RnfABCDGE type electron transport complex subunit D [Firmicutes bacterium]|nr:RnfABCDGE type electron transport complex subunit D [Bacillota bacterium]